MTVLVVEDNPRNQRLFRLSLEMDGITVLIASDAEEAIEIARTALPDIILMDLGLPGMDGFAATSLLKADPQLSAIPVVALTAHAMDSSRKRALAGGFEGYITKPIDTLTFSQEVRSHLRPPTEPAAHGVATEQQGRILIVDDEPRNVRLLAMKLGGEPYEILTASSGVEAMALARSASPDIILLDVMMPEVSGFDVTRELKGDDATKHIPIVLVTALDGAESRAKGLALGADEYLNKPVNTQELLTRVRSMIQLKRYHEQLTNRAASTTSPRFAVVGERRESTQHSVMVVEDNGHDARLLRAHLQEQGYSLTFVSSVRDAEQHLATRSFDLLIVDVLLPDGSGLGLCQRLKADPTTKNTQVLVLTALTDLESRLRGLESGADDYLVKPVHPRELPVRVRGLLEKKAHLDRLVAQCDEARQAASVDGLTGLYSRAYFEGYLRVELSRATERRYPVGLLLIDIDDFKALNDRYGHAAGDDVLRQIGARVAATLRGTDLAARYGGDELVAVLPYTGSHHAALVAQRLSDAVSLTPLTIPGAPPQHVTISVGAAAANPGSQDPDALIADADLAMYETKRARKRTAVA